MNAGAFYLRAMPPALFFILYFETGSHEVVEGLTNGRERETGRGRERDREGGKEREHAGARTHAQAEAGREPGPSGLRLPKYWDYKRAPPRPANLILFPLKSINASNDHLLSKTTCMGWGLKPLATGIKYIGPAINEQPVH